MGQLPDQDEDFIAFVTARQDGLIRLAILLCGEVHRAQDLVQEALIKAYRHWGKVQGASSPDAYVRTIVVREFLSWRRRRSSALELASDAVPEAAQGHDLSEQVAISDQLRRALAELTPRQRAVVVLRFYQDLDDHTIARHLGYAPGSIASIASRAVQQLRPLLVSEGER